VSVAALRAALSGPLAARLDRSDRTALEAALPQMTPGRAGGGEALVAGGTPVGRILPFGSIVLYRLDPVAPLRHRILEVDGGGRAVTAIERGPGGALRAAWLARGDGGEVGVVPGGARHPLWGPSDRLVTAGPAGAAATLTLAGAVDWAAVDLIPPVAEPARLPPGSGGAILNLLAALALDQGRGALRYRGPYPTEQLFWSLADSFRVDRASEALARFLGDAEGTFLRGEPREAPVDWTPAPHERRLHGGGVAVALRDGVEKVAWGGRTYVRPEWQGLRRREHRIVREVEEPDGRRYVASLEALGRAIEDHLVVDARGALLERRPVPPDDAPDRPVAPAWAAALGALVPLEATPLLAGAIEAVWPTVRLVWGGVPGDLVEAPGETVRLSPKLLGAYGRARAEGGTPARALAQRLVREVLGLVGPAVRARATAWLEALPAARQEAVLREGARRDRAALARAALAPLGRLLDALEAGAALPD
jgi:hypothetical protein